MAIPYLNFRVTIGWALMLFVCAGLEAQTLGTMADKQIENLYRESEKLTRRDPQQSIAKIDSAMDLFHSRNNLDSSFFALMQVQWGYAHGLYQPERFSESVSAFESAISILQTRLKGESRMVLARIWQKFGVLYATNDKALRAKNCFLASLDERTKIYGPNNIELAIAYESLGNNSDQMGNYEEAYSWHEKAYQVRANALGTANQFTMISVFNLGAMQMRLENYSDALAKEIIAYNYFNKNNREDLLFGHICNLLGTIYQQLGDPDQAIAYFEQAITAQKDVLSYGDIYVNIGVAYSEKHEFKQANAYFMRGLEAYSKKSGSLSQVIGIYFHQVENEIKQEHFGYALSRLNELSDTLKQLENGNALEAFQNRLNTLYGDCWLGLGDTSSAQAAFRRALPAPGRPVKALAYDLAETYYKLSLCLPRLAAIGPADSALYWSGYRQAGHTYHNFSGVPSYFAVKLTAFVDDFVATRNEALIPGIERLIEDTYQAFEDCRNYSPLESTRQQFSQRNNDVIAKIVAANLALYTNTCNDRYIQLAFQYAGKAKAVSLKTAVHLANVTHWEGIPDSLLTLRRRLLSELAWMEKVMWEIENDAAQNKDSLSFFLLQSHGIKIAEYFDLEKRLEQMPEWKKINKAPYAGTVAALQSTLLESGKKSLLQFVAGTKELFQFVVTPDTFLCRVVSLDPALDSALCIIPSCVENFPFPGTQASIEAKKAFIAFSPLLYDRLIAPVRGLLTQDITLIPDGVLSRLPFDLLLSSRPTLATNWREMPYLVKEFNFHYAWTPEMQYLQASGYTEKRYQTPWVGFAPFGSDDTSIIVHLNEIATREGKSREELGPLKYTYSELQAINQFTGGKIFIEKEATVGAFFGSCPSAKILHFATHAHQDSLNSDFGWLAFYPENRDSCLLYARQIYALHIPAKMVVLSACFSGTGQYRSGEGVISLARAFSWAGAESVVSSIWKANDAGTERLMVTFYKNLKKGMPQSEAMRKAKLSMLAPPSKQEVGRYLRMKVDYSNFAHPYFWAGFTLLGKDTILF